MAVVVALVVGIIIVQWLQHWRTMQWLSMSTRAVKKQRICVTAQIRC